MRVAFDFNQVLVNRFSGLYTFGTCLLEGFERCGERPELLLFCSKRYLQDALAIKERLGNWAQLRPTLIKMRWLRSFWLHCNHPKLELLTGPFDIYHSFHHLMPPANGKPRLLTVHDLRRHKLPHLYKGSNFTLLFELAVKCADHFIAVSESTKNDLCEIFDISPDKVDVVYQAANPVFNLLEKSEKEMLKKKLEQQLNRQLGNYLLVFSSSDKRKNVSRIIEAFIHAKNDLPDNLKLVVVGNPPKDDKAIKSYRLAGGSDNIIITGPVDDMTVLLGCAEGLVFASLYEGFGLPILEAFACGVPVITSNCSSMPEVAGKAALYVDPYDTDSIVQEMIKLCNNKETKQKLTNLGLERYQQFSWQKSATETLKVYKKLL